MRRRRRIGSRGRHACSYGQPLLRVRFRLRRLGYAFRRAAPREPSCIPRVWRGRSPRYRHAGRSPAAHPRRPYGSLLELASLLMERLRDAVSVVDEVHGFRYFDLRDMVGFVDGTENPSGREAVDFTLISDQDPAFAGGSYVMVQKYLHDMAAWDALSVEAQERIIGRKKLSDVELADGIKPSSSHSSLTTIEKDGQEVKILRHNMAFGRPGAGEFGTYFIGYASSPEPIEQMLENMFVGRPPGNYDRLLDYSRAVTGGLFFVPSASMLEALADRDPPAFDQ